MLNKKLNKKSSGFTMIEIVVVLFIVSMGLFGVMSLIIQNIQSQSYDKNTLIAGQLAQEGIELIREVRDSNWLAGRSFDANLASGMGSYQYYMDYQDAVPHKYTNNPAELILKQGSKGYYLDSTAVGVSSIFSRLITIKKLSLFALQVDSKVSWRDHGRNYSYKLETLLYDWK